MGQDAGHEKQNGGGPSRPPGAFARLLSRLSGTRAQRRGESSGKAFLGRDASAGMTFGVTLVVFALGGHGLDTWLGTSPIFLLLGAALGGIAGFIYLVEAVSPGTLFPSRKDAGRKDGTRGGTRDGSSPSVDEDEEAGHG